MGGACWPCRGRLNQFAKLLPARQGAPERCSRCPAGTRAARRRQWSLRPAGPPPVQTLPWQATKLGPFCAALLGSTVRLHRGQSIDQGREASGRPLKTCAAAACCAPAAADARSICLPPDIVIVHAVRPVTGSRNGGGLFRVCSGSVLCRSRLLVIRAAGLARELGSRHFGPISSQLAGHAGGDDEGSPPPPPGAPALPRDHPREHGAPQRL